jgi:hypothetical protein
VIRVFAWGGCLALLPLLATAVNPRQQPVFSSSTTRVRLAVSVFSASGAVRGLEAADFHVRDGGREIEAIDVLELSDLPLDVLIVQQESASLTPDQERVFAVAFSTLLSRMRRDDRVGTITTGLPPRVTLPLGPPTRQVDPSPGAATESALWDAIALASSQFDAVERRQVIVVLSAGIDRRSLLTPAVVLDAARRGRMQIVYLGFDVVPRATMRLSTNRMTGRVDEEATFGQANRFPPDELKKLTDTTGGQIVNLAVSDPASTVRDVVDRLRFGYLLSFSPQPEPGWHPVQVTVRKRGVTVAARDGYVR